MRRLTALTVAEKRAEFKRYLAQAQGEELSRASREAVHQLLQAGLDQEFGRYIGAERHQRSPGRRDQRNGRYQRWLDTCYGGLCLQVPRGRRKGFSPTVFDSYQRLERQLRKLIQDLFLTGLPIRRVKEALWQLCGVTISDQTASRICQELDFLVAAFHARPLQDQYRYLILDALALKLKTPLGPRKRLVLVAYAITVDGVCELVDYLICHSESEADCTRFLNNLRRRGLRGAQLKLITTDGSGGLQNACDWVYPHVPRQRCWVHKLRNVANKLRHKHKKPCLTGACQIYLAANQRQALSALRRWRSRWQELEPAAVACLEKDLDQLLAVFALPAAHRVKVRTTNPIERAFREVRRRTRTQSCFENLQSCERQIFAALDRFNQHWQKHPLKQFTHKT